MRIRTTAQRADLIVWSVAGVRGRIVGNPHTHPGRFSVQWDGDARPHPASLTDLEHVSNAAEIWLAGFLAGQSPDASEVLDDVGDFLTDDQRSAWSDVNEEFQTSGVMPEAWLRRRAEREVE